MTHSNRIILPLALTIALAACDSSKPAEQATPSPAPMAEAAPATSTPVPAAETSEPAPVVTPIRTVAPEDAIRAYYAAIDAGEFERAYRLWNHEGQASGQSFTQFRQGFAATRSTEVTITGPVESEGAAGSIYVTVPVQVDAVLKDGAHQRFAGQYVLRRVNSVPGATEEQLNWHIESASLRLA